MLASQLCVWWDWLKNFKMSKKTQEYGCLESLSDYFVVSVYPFRILICDAFFMPM